MKFIIFTVLSCLLTSAAFAAPSTKDEPMQARFLGRVTLEQHAVSAEGARSAEILIDYVKVLVDCHGPTHLYTATENAERGIIYVEKRVLPRKAIPCPHDSPLREVQTGLKLKVKGNSYGVYRQVLTPADVVVQFIAK